MNIELEELPFEKNALEPVISADTMALHHGSHQSGYLKKLKELIAGTEYERRPLEEIIGETQTRSGREAIFNNAAQAWNHAFFWHSLAPVYAPTKPSGCFLRRLIGDFGSLEGLKEHLISTAAKRFGSGWLWLVSSGGRLAVYTTANAETPVTNREVVPLLTVDLWEHAYYLDWHNRRGEYVEAVVEKLLDWEAASRRYEANKQMFIRESFCCVE